MVRLSLLPVGDGPLHAAQVVSYLVEGKLLWPLGRLYEPKVLARFYGLQHSLLRSPFKGKSCPLPGSSACGVL